MSVRNLGELGLHLQKIITRLMANDVLVKLLYYPGQDPLAQDELTQEEKSEKIFNELIKVVPLISTREDSRSTIVIYVGHGQKISGNKEFRNIFITIDVIVPLSTWIIKDSNLRPFAILGQIQESLDGKIINKLGKLDGGDFDLVDITQENSIYSMTFSLTDYD